MILAAKSILMRGGKSTLVMNLIIFYAFFASTGRKNLCRNAYCGPSRGNVLQNNGPCANFCAVTYSYWAKQNRTCTNDYAISHFRVPSAVLRRTLTPEGYTVKENAIVPDDCGFTDHNTGAVVNEKAPSDGRTRMNFNLGAVSDYLRDNS
jgi:hypothetical protein